MRYLNVSGARASFLRLVDNLDERVAIMRNGQPVAVLLDFDDYRGLCAAEALARDPQRLTDALAIAKRVREGDLEGFKEVTDPSTVGSSDRHSASVAPPKVYGPVQYGPPQEPVVFIHQGYLTPKNPDREKEEALPPEAPNPWTGEFADFTLEDVRRRDE